jgi:hypothetical protein
MMRADETDAANTASARQTADASTEIHYGAV